MEYKFLSLYVYCSLEGEVSGLFLQSSACAGTPGVRDSGYDSLRRRMSILDRLMQTHSVWLLLSLSDEEARRILQPQPAGVKTLSAQMQQPTCSTTIGYLAIYFLFTFLFFPFICVSVFYLEFCGEEVL